MAEIKYTELDFNLIKENLKTFLKSQDKFKDYNFDGSSLSILLDVLAYNTGYNGFYLNMLASEMFLDSASLDNSVASRAKHLGYTPRSVRTSVAIIDYSVTVTGTNLPIRQVLPKSQPFFTTVDGTRYTFYPRQSRTLDRTLVSTDGNGFQTVTYTAKNLEIVEGKRLIHSYTVDNTSPVKQRYVMPNQNVDTSTLSVTVKESASSSNISVYNLSDDITEVSSTDLVYFMQAYAPSNEEGLYEVIFGDDIIGKNPQDGNIIQLNYIVSSGDGATGANSFRAETLGILNSQTESFSITTLSPANGFSERENKDSVKLLAPRNYEAQNRAVTKYDYETLIKKDVSSVQHVRVWGGEENIPPEYGKVFCAIKPFTGDTLNLEDKERILTTFIKPRNLVTLDVSIIDPEYIRLELNCSVNYNSNKTVLDEAELQNLIYNNIRAYRDSSISGFDVDFRYSKLLSQIDNSDNSIVSSESDITIKYRVIPRLNLKNSFTIQLNNEIDTGDFTNDQSSVRSSLFLYRNSRVYLADNGKGILFVYYFSQEGNKVIVEPNIGSVNYSTGEIVVNQLLVSSIPNGLNYIDFFIVPKDNDIIALREQIILIDDSDISIEMTDVNRLRLS